MLSQDNVRAIRQVLKETHWVVRKGLWEFESVFSSRGRVRKLLSSVLQCIQCKLEYCGDASTSVSTRRYYWRISVPHGLRLV